MKRRKDRTTTRRSGHHGAIWAACLAGCMSLGALAAEPWQSAPGHRWRDLGRSGGTTSGFVRLGPETTGVAFTNLLSEWAGAENRVLYNGAGVAVGDVDGDGLPDLFLCQLEGRNALYRNRGGWRFEDVTVSAGLAEPRPGTRGAVFADVNGDRRPDLLLSINARGVACFVNQGGGRFEETTREAGVSGPWGSTTLALADVDGNGTLDLYVTNYRTDDIRDRGRVQLTMVNGRPTLPGAEANRFLMVDGRLEECGQPDQLFLNDGQGRFRAVSWTGGAFLDAAGVPLTEAPTDWGLTATFRDVNADGAPDLYVCNDYWTPDRFWIGDGRGRFRAAPALALRKMPASSMSVDFADVDRDGVVDFLALDMLSRSPGMRKRQMLAQNPRPPAPGMVEDRPQVLRNTLFRGVGGGAFAEVGYRSGLAATDWSWSAVFCDVDLDGYEDVLIGAGHFRDVQDIDAEREVQGRQRNWAGFRSEAERQKAFTRELMEHFRLYPKLDLPVGGFRNRGDGTFEEWTDRWGLNHAAVHQGLALADFDGDGDLDLVDNTLNTACALYRNDAGARLVSVRLRGQGGNEAGIGAKVVLLGGAVPRQTTEILAGGRYLSGSEPRAVFAAGSGAGPLRIEVTWRNGRRSVVPDVRANREYEIDEDASVATGPEPKGEPSPLFRDVSAGLAWRHRETTFDELARQPLLPYRRAQAGPGVSWIDLDGDGREDLLMGQAEGEGLAVAWNEGEGRFRLVSPPGAVGRPRSEAAGWVAGAWDERGPSVVAGAMAQRDGGAEPLREFRWEGREPKEWPANPATTGPVATLATADVFGNGRPLLFAGGGALPGRYPLGASSRLYAWDGARWSVNARTSVQFENLGIVQGAVWTDLDGDGFAELVLACEWGAVRVFQHRRGVWRDATRDWGLLEWTGWWRGVTAGDFNGDGRMDLVAANWGWNSAYVASTERPLVMAYGELAQPGVLEVIETEWVNGKLAPRRSYRDLVASLPFLQEAFPRVADFAVSDLDTLLGERAPLARKAAVVTLATTVFWNLGGTFRPEPLPGAAQDTPVSGIGVADWDGDGNEDLFLAQNFHGTRPDEGRIDAGRGLVLLGNGAGGWRDPGPRGSGVDLAGEQRGVAVADFDGDARPDLAVGQNGGELALLRNVGGRPGVRVRLQGPPGNRWGIGAVLRWEGEGPGRPARELHAGAGYRSMDAPVTVLARPGGTGTARLTVRWPGGKTSRVEVPAEAREVTVPYAE